MTREIEYMRPLDSRFSRICDKSDGARMHAMNETWRKKEKEKNTWNMQKRWSIDYKTNFIFI